MASNNTPPSSKTPAPAGALQKTGGAGAGAVSKTSALGTLKIMLSGEQFKSSLLQALPKHCDADRQLRVILTAVTKTPKLADCSQESLMVALLDCSQLGLEPDGRRAHLIPYGNSVKLIIDYKGLIELIMRSGFVDYIDAFPVYKNEKFKLRYGSHPSVEHEPVIHGEAGELLGVYAVAHIKDTKFPKFAWMRKTEVDAIRARSQSGNNGPWVTDYVEMAKKTVIRRLSKTLPQSAEVADAFEKDNLHDGTDDIPVNRLQAMKAARVTTVVTDPPQLTETNPPPDAEQQQPAGETQQPEDLIAQAEREAALEEESNRLKVEAEQKAAEELKKKNAAAAAAAQKAPAASNTPPAAAKTSNTPPAATKPAAPAAPAPSNTPPATGLPASSPEDVANLRAKLEADGLVEVQVCRYATAVYRTPTTNTLDELAAVSQRRVTLILHQYEACKDKIAKQPK